MKRAVIVIAALIAAAAAARPLEAQEDQEPRFQLFNECHPVGLGVALARDDGDLPEQLEERIERLAESRLRAARLFSPFSPRQLRLMTGAFPHSFLSIEVTVVGRAFSGRVSFYKRVYDPPSGVSDFALTWRSGDTGTHRGGEESAAFIMQRLSELVDAFVLEYLRVNEESCNDA